MVKVAKSQEGAYVLNFGWRRPVLDTGNFDRVHVCHPPSKDYPQVIHFWCMEQTFVEGEEKVMLFSDLQDISHGLDVIREGSMRSDSYVINVYSDRSTLWFVLEDGVPIDEVHHRLEGGW